MIIAKKFEHYVKIQTFRAGPIKLQPTATNFHGFTFALCAMKSQTTATSLNLQLSQPYPRLSWTKNYQQKALSEEPPSHTKLLQQKLKMIHTISTKYTVPNLGETSDILLYHGAKKFLEKTNQWNISIKEYFRSSFNSTPFSPPICDKEIPSAGLHCHFFASVTSGLLPALLVRVHKSLRTYPLFFTFFLICKLQPIEHVLLEYWWDTCLLMYNAMTHHLNMPYSIGQPPLFMGKCWKNIRSLFLLRLLSHSTGIRWRRNPLVTYHFWLSPLENKNVLSGPFRGPEDTLFFFCCDSICRLSSSDPAYSFASSSPGRYFWERW